MYMDEEVSNYDTLTVMQAEELTQYKLSGYSLLAMNFKHVRFPLKLTGRAVKLLLSYSGQCFAHTQNDSLEFNGHWSNSNVLGGT
jgi:hypothetical protein